MSKIITPDSPEEWEMEQRVFHAVGRKDVPSDVQKLIADLWKQICLLNARSHPGAPTREQVALAAMAGLLGGVPGTHLRPDKCAASAFEYADAFLAARSRSEEDNG